MVRRSVQRLLGGSYEEFMAKDLSREEVVAAV
jgi:hypothetical protein